MIDELVAGAERAAGAAAARSGVQLRELEEIADLTRVQELFDRIWGAEPGHPHISAELLRALAVAGSYVVGAYDGDDALLAACVGFAGPPARRSLHSHIAGVDLAVRGRDLGFALKVHQRAWSLRNGFEAVSWTFDPLVRRNAHFNVSKLGARAVRYFPDFYGPMSDGINRDDASDRIYVRWELTSERVGACCGDAGAPAAAHVDGFEDAAPLLGADPADRPVRCDVAAAPRAVVGLPEDIEELRRADPATSRRWRSELRDVLQAELAAGSCIVGFDRRRGYLIERGGPP